MKKYIKEELISIAISGLIFVIVLLWRYFVGYKFEWREIDPISAPELWQRAIYSTFVFITFGALLYNVKFYRALYVITVNFLGDRRLFRDIKKILWIVLILIMYFKVVPIIVELLNSIISFIYNIFSLLVYLSPVIGLSLIGLILFSLINKYIYNVNNR